MSVTRERLLEIHAELANQAKDIMDAKNKDYSGGNGDTFANFRGSKIFGVHPVIGILLRVQDKMKRIETFARKGELAVKNEPVEDALRDIINYTVLIAGLIEEMKGI